MKTKLIVVLTVVQLIAALNSFAQKKLNTGYMGKKVFISYTSKAFPNINALGKQDSGFNPINYSHNVDFNYIYKWRKTFSVSFTYEKSKISNPDVNYKPLYYGTSYNEYAFTYYDFKKSLNINTFGGSMGLKFQNRKKHAPVGPYIKWSVIYLTQKVKLGDYDYNYWANNKSYSVAHRNEFIKLYSAGAEFSFGNQRVFYDKIVLSYGMSAALIIAFADSGIHHGTYYSSIVLRNISETVITQNFLRAHLSIGFLAF